MKFTLLLTHTSSPFIFPFNHIYLFILIISTITNPVNLLPSNINAAYLASFRENENPNVPSNKYMQNADISETSIPQSSLTTEKEILATSASSGTTFQNFPFLFQTKNPFCARNSLSQFTSPSSYWQSQNKILSDYWEAYFSSPSKINKIIIQWRNPPKQFKLFFKHTENQSQFIPATIVYEKQTTNKINTITFTTPIIAKTIRVALYTPLNGNNFSIKSIRFYTFESIVLIKNSYIEKCKQFCLYVNSNIPSIGDNIEAYSCADVIAQGNNNELFQEKINGNIMHYNSKYCIGFNNNGEVILENCGKYNIEIRSDLSLYFKGFQNKCIMIDMNSYQSLNYIDDNTILKASSEMDMRTFRLDNLKDKDGELYWQSVPGEREVSLLIDFSKKTSNNAGLLEIKKVDIIKLDWIKEPLEFMIYTWIPGQTWIMRKKVINNKLKHNEIYLIGVEASAVLIKLIKPLFYPDIDNLPLYSLKNIFIGSNSYKIRYEECKAFSNNVKKFEITPQFQIKNLYTKHASNELNTFILKYNNNIETYKTLIHQITKVQTYKEHARKYIKMYNEYNKKIQKIYNDINKENINIYEDNTNHNQHVISEYGSEGNPSVDCDSLIKMNNNIQSGFYYIKTTCNDKVLKVYCDFNSFKGKGIDYYIYENNIQNNDDDIPYIKIINYNSIRYQCAKKGLYPIQIQNKQMIQTINTILSKKYTQQQYIIPIGYDYSCDNQNKCSGQFHSLNTINSISINKFISFSLPSQTNNTMICLTNTGVSTFNPLQHIINSDITAFICSTNNHIDSQVNRFHYKYISCGLTLGNNIHLFKANQNVLVKCNQCNVSKYKVYGNGKYADRSSICLSAIHFGVIDHKGGMFYVKVLNDNVNEFIGSNSNGVVSLDMKNEERNVKGFIVKKYKERCPIDSYSNEVSFMEMESAGFGDYGNDINLIANSVSDKIKNIGNVATNKAKDVIMNSSGNNDSIQNFASAFTDSIIEDTIKANAQAKALLSNPSELEKKLLPNNNNNNNNNNNDGSIERYDKNNDEPRDMKVEDLNHPTAEEPFPFPHPDNNDNTNNNNDDNDNNNNNECSYTTTSEIQTVENIFSDGFSNLISTIQTKLINLNNNIQKLKQEISWIHSNDLSPNTIYQNLRHFYQTKATILKLLQQFQSKMKSHLTSSNQVLHSLQKEYSHLNQYNHYNSIINLNQFTMMYYENNIDIQTQKPYFEWTRTPDKEHINAIGITFTKKEGFIHKENENSFLFYNSIIYLTYGKWMNFEGNVNINIKYNNDIKINDLYCGVVFHVQNEFNFYAVEIDITNNKVSLIITLNGIKNVLHSSSINQNEKDNLLNKWINVFITYKSNTIVANINSIQLTYKINNKYSLLSLNDGGSFGFFTNNVNISFDNLNIKTLYEDDVKQNNNKRNENNKYPIIINNKSNIYYETFAASLQQKLFFKYNSFSNINDIPNWKVLIPKINNKIYGLAQDSQINFNNKYERAFALYKELYVTNGTFIVGFIPNYLYNDNMNNNTVDGKVSFVFKYYKDYKNNYEVYYAFDIIKDNQTCEFILRKTHNGNNTILQTQQCNKDIFFNRNYLYEINIKLYHGKIEINVYLQSTLMNNVNEFRYDNVINYTTKNDDIKFGSIGLGTAGMSCLFTKIELIPFKASQHNTPLTNVNIDHNHNNNNTNTYMNETKCFLSENSTPYTNCNEYDNSIYSLCKSDLCINCCYFNSNNITSCTHKCKQTFTLI